MNYIKDAIGVLAGPHHAHGTGCVRRAAGRRNGCGEAQAILNQLDAAIRARGRRAEKERERRLLEEGAGGRINVPYSQGGQKALGVAFAEQQLVAAILKNPDYIRLAAPRVSGGTFLDAAWAGHTRFYARKAQRVNIWTSRPSAKNCRRKRSRSSAAFSRRTTTSG